MFLSCKISFLSLTESLNVLLNCFVQSNPLFIVETVVILRIKNYIQQIKNNEMWEIYKDKTVTSSGINYANYTKSE